MAIEKVWIIEGCISCGLCNELAPEVFRMEEVAVVNEGVNYSNFEAEIKESAESCPTEVIKYQ